MCLTPKLRQRLNWLDKITWISLKQLKPIGKGPFLVCSIDNPNIIGDLKPKVVKKVSEFWHTHWLPIPKVVKDETAD